MINWKLRLQNPIFWIGMVIGIGSIILGYFGLTAPDLTSWGKVLETVIMAINNPYVVGSIAIYVLGLFIDTSTLGFKDSVTSIAKNNIKESTELIIKEQIIAENEEAVNAESEGK
jgi:phi LC3 family holin